MTTMILSDITETKNDVTRRVVVAECRDPVTVVMYSGKCEYTNVYVDNASSRAWRGPGRTFWSREEALRHYKSAAMKELLSYCFAT